MDPSTQAVPGYYVWELPGKPVVVHLRLDVIDRLSAEVMRGFGLVPKRGAEVGGVLLGTIEKGDRSIVRIEDFEAVACNYKRGPSYLFTADDGTAFDEACARWQPDSSRPVAGVGYFRSHTREGFAMAPEDVEIMEQYFPAAANVALLVKPFATKVSAASFFVREAGLFPSTALLEFPLRRRELTGEDAPPRRPLLERAPRRSRDGGYPVAPLEPRPAEPIPGSGEPYRPPGSKPGPAKSRPRTGWVWLPLSFVFLLLGMALGFLLSLSVTSRSPFGGGQDISLGLSVVKSGDSLNVKWNRDSPAIRASSRGTLEIAEGSKVTPVTLDKVTLESGGNIVYTNSSSAVHFQLKIFPRENLTVVETADWTREPVAQHPQ